MGKGKVLQDWMCELPWIQQGSILAALRGPDANALHVKNLSRWVRRITQQNADPSNDYTGNMNLPEVQNVFGELEYITTCHYTFHLIGALEIIGYKHPSDETRKIARDYYFGIVDALHLNPETEEQLDIRLEDKV